MTNLPQPTLLTDEGLPELSPHASSIWQLLSDHFWPLHGVATATMRLSDNETVHQLNQEFRQQDKPTNVLSFPDGEADNNIIYLGDIILAHETIQHEARAQQKSYEDHLKHLLLHGILHLYGYDHETAADAKIMEKIEIQLLSRLNIANPYE